MKLHPSVKPLLFCLCLVPLAVLVWGMAGQRLGPDPAEQIMHVTGEWAGRLLLATLLITPLRRRKGWGQLLRLRRMLGLFTFFYACCHLAMFVHFFLGWDGRRVLEELLERPYITAGFLAWLIMLPLALTSTNAMQRRLRANWGRLHRGIYLVALLFILHITWMARSDYGEALVYAVPVLVLLGWRLRHRLSPRYKKTEAIRRGNGNKSIEYLGKNWEDMALEDPLWAVLTDPAKKGGQWDPEEFYETGKDDAHRFMTMVSRVCPDLNRTAALDFGCGVGRVTYALKEYFQSVVGVDISRSMIDYAERRNSPSSGVRFLLNQQDHLRCFGSSEFDFVFSRIVLQHMHPDIACSYLREFVRILRPGGACMFQLPGVSVMDETNPPEDGSVQMEMWGIAPRRILELLEEWKVELLLAERETACGEDIPSYIYVFYKPGQ